MKKIAFLLVFFFSNFTFAIDPIFPSDERLLEIEQLVESFTITELIEQVLFVENVELRGPAMAVRDEQGRPTLQFNSKIMKSLPNAGQLMIRYHELGHVHLGHINQEYPGIEAAAPLELEADAFAIFAIIKFGELNQELFDFIEWISEKNETVPSGALRAEVCRKIIGDFHARRPKLQISL